MNATASAPVTRRQYLRRLQSVILRHVLYRGDVHADMAIAAFPIPEGVHVNTVGAAFSGLESAGLIKAVGFERSVRASRHRGVSRVWRVCDTSGVRGYLRALASSGDDVQSRPSQRLQSRLRG